MEKFNKSGRILIEYRDEFKKHYSDSIDEALKEAINGMYLQRKIDEKVFRNIFNEKISDIDFENILLSKKEFTKSNDELNYEFDKVRKLVNNYMISIGFTEYMKTKNSLDLNKIIIMHQFDLNREYIMSSFGVNDSELIPLMKRRGFVEKFAVLRLNQVLKEIYNELKIPEDIDHGYSLVYYNKETKSFSIDYKYYVSIIIFKKEEKRKELIDKIRELDNLVSERFKEKLGVQYFSEENKSKNKLNIKNKKIKETEPTISPVEEVVKAKNKTVIYKPNNKKVEKTEENKKEKQNSNELIAEINNKNKKESIKENKETEENKKENKGIVSEIIDIEFDISDKDLL